MNHHFGSCPRWCFVGCPDAAHLVATERIHFVYWMFRADGTCLYVGCTMRPEGRWKQHRRVRPHMTAEVASRRMSGPYTLSVARRIEREQQDLLAPIYDGRVAGLEKSLRTRAANRAAKASA